MGRVPENKELKIVEEIVKATMPSLTQAQRALMRKGNTLIETNGQERVVAEMEFYGASKPMIAKALVVSDEAVHHYMSTPRYHALKMVVEQELLGKLGEALFKMAEIGAAEAMRGKLHMMRELAKGTRDKALLNKMYTEMIDFWIKMRPTAGAGSESLVHETWKRMQKKRMADGSTETIEQTIIGPAQPLGSGAASRIEPLPSLPGGDERPPEGSSGV